MTSWLVLSLLLGCAGAVCPLPPVSEGAKLTTITHDGVPRSWYTYVPASVAAAPQRVVPLVVDLHGVYSCVAAGYYQNYIGWIQKAEVESGFILVWPQAADEPIGANGATGGPRWNAGMCDECVCENCVYHGQGNNCCRVDANATDVPSNDVDDVGFLREVVAQVAAAHGSHPFVDATRVYITGHSYGCVMAQRVLAEASDLFAAGACFSGALNLADDLGVYPLTTLSSEYTPRPLMIIHGTYDATLPYGPYDFPGPYLALGAEKNLALWGGYNGCPGDAATETPKDNYTLHEINCNGVVSALVEVPGVGHYPFYTSQQFPPSARNDDRGGAPFDTTQLAWDFLKGASMPAPSPNPSPPPVPPPVPPPAPPSTKDCPFGCVSVNARQRRQLLFGSIPIRASCPKGCVRA